MARINFLYPTYKKKTIINISNIIFRKKNEHENVQANPKPDLFPSDRRNFPLKRLRAIVIKHQNDEQRGINFPAYISQIQTERRDSLGGTILPPRTRKGCY